MGCTSWHAGSAASLRTALMPPTRRCVETSLAGIAAGQAVPRSADGLGLSISSRTACRLPVAGILVEAIGGRIAISDSLAERLHTAVQEALMNALVHGSLGLDASLRDSLAGLAFLDGMIEKRLSALGVARGAIHLQASWTPRALRIVISDGGSGFSKSVARLPEQAPGDRKRGRGITILETMCDRVAFIGDGSSVELRFKLDGSADATA